MIKTGHRVGNRIVGSVPVAAPQKLSIGLLTPNSLEQLPAHTTLWIDELDTLLFERGIKLAPFSSHRFSAAVRTRRWTGSSARIRRPAGC